MTRRDLICMFLGAVFAVASNSRGELRFEGAVGQCKYRLAEDTSWHYGVGPYFTNMELTPHCGQLGVLWKPNDTFGLRFAYVDLGTVTAENSYPVDEPAYMRAKATSTGIVSETAIFQGQQQARGLSVGPVIEKKAAGLTWSVEGGVSALYITWRAMTPVYPDWRFADGWKFAPYVGAGVRKGIVTAGFRVYSNAHASRTDICEQCFGPTKGPVVQTLVGLSWKPF